MILFKKTMNYLDRFNTVIEVEISKRNHVPVTGKKENYSKRRLLLTIKSTLSRLLSPSLLSPNKKRGASRSLRSLKERAAEESKSCRDRPASHTPFLLTR